MKQFFKMFFASLFAMIVAGILVFGVLIGFLISAVSDATSEKEVSVKENSVLVIDLSSIMKERSQKNSFSFMSDDNGFNFGLSEFNQAIAFAQNDKQIKGILIKTNGASLGWATAQKMRGSLLNFKKSKKFIYAYGDGISQGDYYLASVADSIFINPIGAVEIKGLASSLMFFKGTLDKLGITPEIFYAGQFKSATEPFRATKMSDPNRLQLATIQNHLWNIYTNDVALSRNLSPAAINSIAVNAQAQNAQDALNLKLVDQLYYWDEVETLLMKKTKAANLKAINYVMMNDYVSQLDFDNAESKNKIAVLYAEGEIIDGKQTDENQVASTTMVEEIRKIANNDKIKAVVLRINSPGGSALASEIMLRELQLLKKKKPLIVSMGDVAASGGYYIASYGDSVFAQPSTITGSIGVFSMMFNIEKLLTDKFGITLDAEKNAPMADFPNATRQFTDKERVLMQQSVDQIYSVFKTRVSNGRHLPMSLVDSIAQGRVWTGIDALRLHLIDAYGDLDRALAAAAAIAHVADYKVVNYPAPIDKFEMFLQKFKGSNAAAIAKSYMQEQMNDEFIWLKKIHQLKQIQGKAQMLMPFQLTIQ
ncbi:MAG: signal peptide peptidase SppA [Bacteroidota bacterium]|nr:signal peptide peptidase SppA [Bacteroidota bacterium]